MHASLSSPKPYNVKKVWKRALTSALGFFSMGYVLNIFNSSQTCVASLLNWGDSSETLIAFMTAITPFGSLFGALVTGYFTKYYGKRSILIYLDLLTIVGSLIGYFPTTVTFGIGRFIQGFTAGSFSMTCSQYVSEFTPPGVYQKMGVIGPLNSMVGGLVSNLVCQALPVGECGHESIYLIFLIFLGPAFVTLFQLYMLLKVFKKESPLWLIRSKNLEMAYKSYESIYSREYAEIEMEKLQKLVESGNDRNSNPPETFYELLTCKTGTTKGMRVGTMVHIFQQVSGINCLIMYSTALYQDLWQGLFLTRALTVIGTLVRISSLLFFLPRFEKLNTKTMIIVGHGVMGFNLLVIGFASQYSELRILCLICIYLYLMAFGCTIGPLCWSYTSHVMPDKGMALGTGVNWFMFTFTVLFFPFMIEWIGLGHCFLLYGGMNLFGVGYFCVDMLEIRGKSKEEVHEMFSKYR